MSKASGKGRGGNDAGGIISRAKSFARMRKAGVANDVEKSGSSRREFLHGTAAVAAAVGAFGGAMPARAAVEKPFRVAILLPSFDQRRWKAADGPYFVKRAKELGMDPLPLQSSNNDPVLQASQVENLLNQNIDGLVLTAVDIDAAVDMVKKCNAAGVPVVAENYIIPKVKLAGVAARDGVELGRHLGRAMIEVAPKGNWVVTKGDEGTDIARLKAQGGMEIIKGAVDRGDIKIVSDQYMRAWAPDLCRKQMEQALTANNNNISAALVYADSMSYGTIQALKAQGLNGKVFVSGEDGEPEMLKLILKGDAYVTAWTKFDEMGVRSAELLYAALAKKPSDAPTTVDNGSGSPIPWFKIGIVNVTKDGKAPNAISVAQFAKENPWWVTEKELGL
jgi:D-xylose transport system substrate-binding protein